MKMKVLKFGGTSVGSVENMANVKSIINDGDKKIVVLSAMSGTTNKLVAIAEEIKNGNVNEAIDKINDLEKNYSKTIDRLLSRADLNNDVKGYVSRVFSFLTVCAGQVFSELLEN